MKKKLLSCLLVLVLLVTLTPISVLAKLPEGVPLSLEAPTIQKIELKKDEEGVPYFEAQLKIPQSVLELDSESPAGGSVFWDYSLKIDNGQWSEFGGGGYLSVIIESDEAKVSGSDNLFIIKFDIIDEGGLGEIDIKNHNYSYKIHFYYDYYEGWPDIEQIYSPASNEATIGSGSFYSKASSWAETELVKASDFGLIPDILKGADMTKPITREEFCELAVLMVERTTKKAAEMVTSNPFTDTVNPQILKAYQLGITTGISKTTFSPKVLINREQCAAMLFRAIKAIKPDSNYSILSVKDFPDQKYISSWAVESTKYMSKIGIIKGDSSGNFMPKATTTSQEAAGYGMATREAAILMTVRSFEKVPSMPIEDNTTEKLNSSGKDEKVGAAQQILKLPSMLQNIPIASDASFITTDASAFMYNSKQSLESLYNMYTEYLKDSDMFTQSKQDDGKLYYVTGIRDGYKILISIALSLGSQVSVGFESTEKDGLSSLSNISGVVPGAAPKELKVKFPDSFYSFPFAADASIGFGGKSDGVAVMYWSKNSTGSLFGMYSYYMKDAKDFFEYEEDGQYGVYGIKNGYKIAIVINKSNSPNYNSEVSISLSKEEEE